jgi:hypothetical protein
VGLLNRHLDDDDFADVWCARAAVGIEESDRPAEGHLRTCAECRARYTAFSGWLAGIRADAYSEADDVLGRERLAVQQQQIFRRLEALEHPGRVIAFPKFARPVAASQASGRRRWTAAAAAAGLITGIGLGQLIDFRTGRPGHEVLNPRPIARVAVPSVDTGRGIQPASEESDETFIEPEITSSQVRVPESLQYLNAITPGARDLDPR